MRIFLDSSAFAKRYISERGSDEVNDVCLKAKELMVSVLCIPEVLSAFNRLRRAKKVNPRDYGRLKSDLFRDLEEMTVINIDNNLMQKTIACLEKEPLRTLDAIHVASAKESYCDLFVSGDRRQSQAAKALKLKLLEV
ncbi:MAG: type II toxin-antitoxin system VapC family toxin [Deltaproteobacteria bacterium]|nr:type II toxin-antitoxin system VapC family toxin [Deltaproteobacteria bacterium]MBI3295006.1 type II toxin-antitoxin system VapC family toxin [Deltaproteobacteria bacterium]